MELELDNLSRNSLVLFPAKPSKSLHRHMYRHRCIEGNTKRTTTTTTRVTTTMTPTSSRKMDGVAASRASRASRASQASRASRASQRRAAVRTPRHSDYSDFRLIGRSRRFDRPVPLVRLGRLGGATPARIRRLRWVSSTLTSTLTPTVYQ